MLYALPWVRARNSPTKAAGAQPHGDPRCSVPCPRLLPALEEVLSPAKGCSGLLNNQEGPQR